MLLILVPFLIAPRHLGLEASADLSALLQRDKYTKKNLNLINRQRLLKSIFKIYAVKNAVVAVLENITMCFICLRNIQILDKNIKRKIEQ